MKRVLLVGPLVWLFACHTGHEGQDVKTADEWIAEQERQAAEDEKKRKMRDDTRWADEETDEEKRKKFDKKQAKLELQRATRSAESCPGVVKAQETKDNAPRGETKVTLHFNPDGTVGEASIPSPFDGTPVGDCVLNAFKKVLVPPFTDGEKIIDWDVNLQDAEEGDEEEE